MKILLILTLISAAMGQKLTQNHLVDIISEPEGNSVHKFGLFVDEDFDPVKLQRKGPKDVHEFLYTDIMRGEVVLAEAHGIKALYISCPNCSVSSGGNVILRYLYNGMTKEFKKFHMEIVRQNNTWILVKDGTRIKSLKMRSKKVFGRVIGIRKIVVNGNGAVPTQEKHNFLTWPEYILQ